MLSRFLREGRLIFGSHFYVLKSVKNNIFKALKMGTDVCALRFSMSGFREQDWMRNIPLYAMSNLRLWGTVEGRFRGESAAL